jgi:Telomere recombination
VRALHCANADAAHMSPVPPSPPSPLPLLPPPPLRRAQYVGKRKPLSLLCKDISTISKHSDGLDKDLFKMMKKALPGPYTFIVPATHQVCARARARVRARCACLSTQLMYQAVCSLQRPRASLAALRMPTARLSRSPAK